MSSSLTDPCSLDHLYSMLPLIYSHFVILYISRVSEWVIAKSTVATLIDAWARGFEFLGWFLLPQS